MEVSYASVSVVVQKLRSRKLLISLGLAIMLGLYPVVCESIVMSSLPGSVSGWVSVLWEAGAGLVLIALVAVLLCSPVLMFFGKSRPFAITLFLCCCLSLGLFLPGMLISRLIRMNGFEQLGIRTKPLIVAIEKYEREKRDAPHELGDLVPDYLPAIPSTGIGAYPKYEFTRLKDERDRWQLTVSCSVGFFNWDEFFYLPSKKYEHRYGGWIEPVGDWAYFHE